MKLASSVLGVSVMLATALVGAHGQQGTTPQQTPQQPTFRAGVDVVDLDVSVFDKDRHPVRGLTAADFTVLEDGKPQPIVAFSAVDISDPPPVTATWMTRAPVDVDSNNLSRGRLWVILLDDDNIRDVKTAPHDFESMRAVARRVVDNLGPDDLATVVFSHDNWEGQGFTADKARLHQAVDRLVTSPRPNHPSKHINECDFLLVLEEVIDDLAVIPHRRKVVVDISTATTCRSSMLTAGAAGNLIDRANSADINVYTLDAAGLRPPGGSNSPVDFLQSLAGNTGGRAIVSTNTPEVHVSEIFDENKSYYLLGYESHNLKTRESLKRVEVKVNRPGVTVRTQTIYDAPAPAGSSRPKSELPPDTRAILDVVPKSDLPLKATAAAFADATGKGAVAAVVVNVGAPDGASAFTDTFDVVVRAFTPDGRPQGEAHQVTSLATAPGGPPRAEILSRLALKPGRYNLRVAAHGKSAAREGSVYTDVVVPDFAKEPVSLSGLRTHRDAGSARRAA